MDHAFAASGGFGQAAQDAVPGVTRMALDQLIPACKVAQAPSLWMKSKKKPLGAYSTYVSGSAHDIVEGHATAAGPSREIKPAKKAADFSSIPAIGRSKVAGFRKNG
jgi:hypothetical protein